MHQGNAGHGCRVGEGLKQQLLLEQRGNSHCRSHRTGRTPFHTHVGSIYKLLHVGGATCLWFKCSRAARKHKSASHLRRSAACETSMCSMCVQGQRAACMCKIRMRWACAAVVESEVCAHGISMQRVCAAWLAKAAGLTRSACSRYMCRETHSRSM